jgi:lysyl-tRNA synthetase class 2
MRWQPNMSLQQLQQRAQIIQQLRQFFAARQVLEVDTPLLMPTPVTDPYLDTFSVSVMTHQGRKARYLQTSPEYAMKRLLAAGSGSIYQLCKAFRDDELGRMHRAEFTMLEWYRVEFDDHQLMAEVSDFFCEILGCEAADQYSYYEVFDKALGINPHQVPTWQLAELAQQYCHLQVQTTALNRDDYLQLLFQQVIEPNLGQQRPAIIYNFPASQAALARLKNVDNVSVAARFEAYIQGVELANGYWELTDAGIQQQRFMHDLARREEIGAQPVPIDTALLTALEQGLPNCAGVALGVDRLLMLAMECKHIDQVNAF